MNSEKRYAGFKTFTDIQNDIDKFLKGEVPDTPVHLGPLNRETSVMVDDLIKMNSKGFIPICSQPGLSDKSQRSYISFIAHEKYAKKLEDYLALNHYPFVLQYANFKEDYCSGNRIAVTTDGDYVFTKATAFGGDLRFFIDCCKSKDLKNYLKYRCFVYNIIDPEWGREKYALEILNKYLEEN